MVVSRGSEVLPHLAEALVESNLDGIFIVDPELRITVWNPAMVALTGVEARLIRGRPARLIGDLGSETRLTRALEGETLVVEESSFRVPLTIREGVFEGRYEPLRGEDGEILGVLAVIRDVGDRVKLERQVRQGQKMEAIGRFAGGIAHDFNNLLTAISGYCDLAKLRARDMDEEDETLQRQLGEIRTAAESASRLVAQLMSFSRIEETGAAPIDLNEVVARTEGLLERVLGERIEVLTNLAHDLGRVRADASELQQVLMNLAINARDAMPDGGTLRIVTRDVEVDERMAEVHSSATSGPHVLLIVTDTGSGMDEATRARAFEPFFTTKPQEKGTGLGLATVYGIVQRYGGFIWLYSEPGHGTAFKIYLPRVSTVEAVEPSETWSAPRRGEGETILVVEDDGGVRALLEEVLVSSGYRVLVAETASAATVMLDEIDRPPDLVVTDLVLPDATGREVIGMVRERHPEVPSLCISGYPSETLAEHGLEDLGEIATHFLQKPFTPKSLLERVSSVLRRHG